MLLWKVWILLVVDFSFYSSIARVAAFSPSSSCQRHLRIVADLFSARNHHFHSPQNRLSSRQTQRLRIIPTTQLPVIEPCRTWTLSAIPPTPHDREKEPGSIIPLESLLLLVMTWAMMIAASFGVFWSEWAILQTGCGPMALPDWLERGCYLGVSIVSSVSVLTRIVAFAVSGGIDEEGSGGGLASLLLVALQDDTSLKGDPPRKLPSTISTNIRILLQVADYLALLAVAGAVVVLGSQVLNGETMDGLSGIDLDKCRARQSFQQNLLLSRHAYNAS